MVWKREEPVRPQVPQAPAVPSVDVRPAHIEPVRHTQKDEGLVNIGRSVVIKGDLSGSEDLTIEGQVEGKIELRQNILTIGPNGKIKALIFAKAVVVQGEVIGNVSATERIDIRDSGTVNGDLSAPRVAIADGAHFRGSIDMQRAAKSEVKAGDTRPAIGATSPTVTAAPTATIPHVSPAATSAHR